MGEYIKRRLSQEQMRGSVQVFIKRVVMTLVGLMVLSSSILFIFVYLPLKAELEKSLLDNFDRLAYISYTALEDSIDRGYEGARSLSSRTMIRNALLEYQEGDLSLQALKAYTQPRYEDGVRALEHLIRAERFAGDNLIAEYATENYRNHTCLIGDEIPKDDEIAAGLCLQEEYSYLVIQSPVVAEGWVLGYDKLIFDLSKQIRMLSTEDIHLDLMYSEEYDRLYAGAQALREGERSSLLYKEADFYRVFHMRDGTYFVAQEDETTLLEPVFRLSLQTLVTSIGVLISFAVAVYFLVIRYAKRELINLEKRRVSLKKAVSKANLDALTMAGTRRFGEEYLEQVFADFRSGAPSPAILLFDIDGLKSINDNYGHSVGDLVIRAISRIVHENIRSQDMLLRWGGDEFVGCFADLDKENSLAFAQKILDLIAEIEVETGDCCIRTSISIGISYFDQEDRSFLEAINRADRAMYQSKTEGKDRANTLYK